LFVLAGTAGLYLHHTAALLLGALDGAALVVCSGAVRKHRFFWHLVAANAVIALLYLPWLPVTLGQMAGMPTNAWMTVPSLAGLRYAVLNIYAQPYAAGLEPWADLAFLAFGVAGVWAARGNRVLVALAFLLLGDVPIASWLISQVRPIMNGKTLLPLAPVFLVFVAVGCSSAGRWRVTVAAALVVVQLWSCRVFFADRPDEAFPAVAAVLQAQAAPGDRLVLARPELEILLHYYGWPRDRLAVFAPPAPGATPGTWFRGGTAQPGVPNGTGRIWLLSRSEASRQAALAKLGDVGPPVADELFGRGRMRNLELSLFQRGS
jgi:hypothetical protein